MDKHKVEYDEIKHGYRLIAIINTNELNHRCGYVGIPAIHPLHGKDYRYEVDIPLEGMTANPTDPMGTFLAIGKLQSDENAKAELSYAANVHGGITYSRGNAGYPVPDERGLWWFGFDCAHAGDDRIDGGQPLDYVIAECHKLADFLHSMEGAAP